MERKVSVYLGNEEDMDAKMKIVDIFISKTPYQNATYYYEMRSGLAEKEKKTLEAAATALKQAKDAAEKKIRKKEEQIKAVKVNRRIQWFEKFYWFISSENYLVISARDAHQNETLIKKYLAKDDIVFHTQVQGSAFTLVKNPTGEPVPYQTIQEAGLATLCHSRCWDQKVIGEVFWVYAEQISKTAPSGQFVSLGSFMIYGRKNFVVPSRLEMGFGLIFKVDEDSVRNHEGERKRKDDGNEITSEDPDRLIKKAISSQVTNEKDTPKEEGEKEGEADSVGAAGSDSEGEDADRMTRSVQQTTTTSRLTVQRELTIGKDTEVTVVSNSVSNVNVARMQAASKKREQQMKKDKKEGKAKELANPQPAPGKKTIEVVDAKKGQQMTKTKKKQLERIAQKYGELDDDERQLHMEMMGSKAIKLTKEEQVMLEKKMREQRGEYGADIQEDEVEEEMEEMVEDRDKEGKGKKGKANEAEQSKGKWEKKDKGTTVVKGKGGQKGKEGGKPSEKQNQKIPAKVEVKQKKEEVIEEKPAPQARVQEQQPKILETKPQVKEERSDIIKSRPEPIPQAGIKEGDDDDEVQDLSDEDDEDGNEEHVDQAAENKKETMSVLNTILDEEGEKNLNETLEFKDYTGIPKGNGNLVSQRRSARKHSSLCSICFYGRIQVQSENSARYYEEREGSETSPPLLRSIEGSNYSSYHLTRLNEH